MAELGEVAATLVTYRRLLGARVRADWQYRTSFLLYMAGQMVTTAGPFFAVAVIFTSVDELAGWTAVEVAFLYGLSSTAFGIADLFVSPVEFASRHIKAGSFDQFLIRPVGALWQLLAFEFAARRVGRTVAPVVVLVGAMSRADVAWSPVAVTLVVVSLLSGIAIYGAIWVVTSAIAFWTVETQEIASTFTYGGDTLTSYPVDVLGRWMGRAVTFVVPLASVAYLPATWLFDKPPAFGLPRGAAWSGPLVATIMVLLARIVWTQAIRHYRSTGS